PRIAKALPKWVMPDHLTILGIVAAISIAVGYILTRFSIWWIWFANFGLLVHWFADSLDGTLARVRHTERENYGYFVDHICDAVTTFLVCFGLGASPLMDMRTGMYLAVGYFMLNIYVHIAAYSMGVFRLSYSRLGPTEVRILIIIANIIVIFWNPVIYHIFGQPVRALDAVGILVGTGFLIVFAISVIKDAIELDREDRAKRIDMNA
ncbi:hypothetical protein DRQ29_02450, partial [bacterium]